MSDPRLEEIASRAESAARASDFAEIASRGRRRRATRNVASGVAAVLVAAVAVTGVRSVYSDQGVPNRPAHHTNTPPTVGTPLRDLTAQQIVDSPAAQLRELSVSADDPNLMAALWNICSRPSCRHQVSAVAVTGDDYQTAHYAKVAFTSSVAWAAGQQFVIQTSLDTLSLVDPGGVLQPLTLSENPSAMRPGEALATRYTDVGLNVYGVDVSAGTAHRIAVPAGYEEISLQRADQTLWGVAPSGIAIRSTDGGASWQQHRATSDQAGVNLAIPSTDPSLLAFVPAGDTVGTQAFGRSDDAGATWQTFHPVTPLPPTSLWQVVSPSGSLLIYATNQGAGAAAQPGVEDGLYESNGTDWRHFHKIAVGDLVGGTNAPDLAGRLVEAVTTGQGRQELLVLTGGQLYRSTDDGRTWTAATAR